MEDTGLHQNDRAASKAVNPVEQLVETLNRASSVSDFLLNASKLFVLLAGGLTVAISIQAHSPLLLILLRGGLVMLVMGLLLWTANWLFLRGTLDFILDEITINEPHEPSLGVDKQA